MVNQSLGAAKGQRDSARRDRGMEGWRYAGGTEGWSVKGRDRGTITISIYISQCVPYY